MLTRGWGRRRTLTLSCQEDCYYDRDCDDEPTKAVENNGADGKAGSDKRGPRSESTELRRSRVRWLCNVRSGVKRNSCQTTQTDTRTAYTNPYAHGLQRLPAAVPSQRDAT